VVTVYSILDFVEEYKITIDGEIKSLVFMIITEGLTLNDLLVQAGGLTVLRQKGGSCQNDISEEIDDANPNKAELFNIEITPDNNEQSKIFRCFHLMS
jgi:protein involved in polysaccharide export with SLBB domain